MTEEWRPVKGYEGLYEVSNLGRTRALARVIYSETRIGNIISLKERIMRPTFQEVTGYYILALRKDFKYKMWYVHRVVATAFCDKPAGCDVVNHLNSIKTDNRPENLEWTTMGENARHGFRDGRQSPFVNPNKARKLTGKQVREMRARSLSGETAARISKDFDVTASMVRKIVAGKFWKEAGL